MEDEMPRKKRKLENKESRDDTKKDTADTSSTLDTAKGPVNITINLNVR